MKVQIRNFLPQNLAGMDLVCQEVRKADRNITNHPSLYRDVGISDGISVFLT